MRGINVKIPWNDLGSPPAGHIDIVFLMFYNVQQAPTHSHDESRDALTC